MYKQPTVSGMLHLRSVQELPEIDATTTYRLVHCADVHLDSPMLTHLSKDMAHERRMELLQTFVKMMDDAADAGARAVLIAGDLFDRRKVSATTSKALLASFARHEGMDVYYLRGNHDYTGFVEDDEAMPPNLHTFDAVEGWTAYELDASGRRRVMLIGAELTGENAAALQQGLHLRQEDYNVVTLHGQQDKYQKKSTRGTKAENVAVDVLSGRGIDYLALGHIHSVAEGRIDGRGIWCYPGCLAGRGFDECGVHGYVVVDIDTDTGQTRRYFIPAARRTLHELHVDVAACRDMTKLLDAIREAWAVEEVKQSDMVKLVLDGEREAGLEIDTAYLWQSMSEQAYFLKVEDETVGRVNAAGYLEEKSLRGEYVRLVMQEAELEEEERRELLRTGILALEGAWDRI